MIHQVWLPLILVICYAAVEGIMHGYYYHWKWLFRKSYHQIWETILKNDGKEIDTNMFLRIRYEHIFFTVQRALIIAGLFFLLPLPSTFFKFILSALSWLAICACVYSLPHNSTYFIIRNKLVPWIYPNTWKTDDVEANSAYINLNLFIRVLLFVLGIAGAILYQHVCYFSSIK